MIPCFPINAFHFLLSIKATFISYFYVGAKLLGLVGNLVKYFHQINFLYEHDGIQKNMYTFHLLLGEEFQSEVSNQRNFDLVDNPDETQEVPRFILGWRGPPPLLPQHSDDHNCSL